jgi:sugar lactone lactonase YvrE
MHLFLSGLGFGEGLRWHDGRFWFSDFLQHHVASVDPEGGGVRIECVLGDRPSGLGWLPDGRLLVVSMRRRAVLRREADGSLVEHADLGIVATSDVNDMVVGPDGTAYVGNFGSDLLAGEPLQPASLAVVTPDGTVTAVAAELMFPNGSVITPDGRTLIVGESLARRYRAFPIQADGSLGESWVWAELDKRSPDGCTLDADGAIWFANAGGREVVRVLPGGEITDVLETPETAYACTLGGPDGRTLVVATSPQPPREDAEPGAAHLWRTRVAVPRDGYP